MKKEELINGFLSLAEGTVSEELLNKEVTFSAPSFASNSEDLGSSVVSIKNVEEKEGNDGKPYVRVEFDGVDLVTSPRYIVKNFPESVVETLVASKEVKIIGWKEEAYCRYGDYTLAEGTYFNEVKANPAQFATNVGAKHVYTPIFG